MQKINLYIAIAEMRQRTNDGKPFSFSFFTYDRQRDHCHGLVTVKRALLRPAAKGDDLSEADHKLFFEDLDTGRKKVCWQPLLAYFNGMQVEIKRP